MNANCSNVVPGNGLIDEAEFLQWVSKIQALQGAITGESADSEDEITRDLLAAFRYVSLCFKYEAAICYKTYIVIS